MAKMIDISLFQERELILLIGFSLSNTLYQIPRAGDMKQDQCSLCTSQHIQTRVILAHLRTKIQKQSQEYVPHYQQKQTSKDCSDSFSRLLALLFGQQLTTSQSNFIHCQHSKLARYFRRKLKCDNQTFNSLCSELASKIAERNYQIQALNTQLNSMTSTAERQASNPLAEKVVQTVHKEREQRERRKKEITTRDTLARAEMERKGRQEMSYYWSNQPPLMHFPWMFRGSHESN